MMRWVTKGVDAADLQVRWTFRRLMIDLIPADLFVSECSGRQIIHESAKLGGARENKCKAILSVKGKSAVFDYAHRSVLRYNKNHDILIGRMVIDFIDIDRTTVSGVHWLGGEKCYKNAAKTNWDVDPHDSIPWELPKRKKSDQAERLVKCRPLQTRFALRLENIYRGRCCITGCNIPEALQAAHIVPASTNATYAPQNGLLLRADIHALFDKKILRINPSTRKVSLVGRAKTDPTYASLEGKRIAEPRLRRMRPAVSALRYQWE